MRRHPPATPPILHLKLTAKTRAEELTLQFQKLQQQRHPPTSTAIEEVELRIDRSFLLGRNAGSDGVLNALHQGLLGLETIRKVNIWGPYDTGFPIFVLRQLIIGTTSRSRLTHLSLNQLTCTGNPAEFKDFVEAIYQCTQLQELRLQSFGIPEQTSEEWLAQALAHVRLIAVQGSNETVLSTLLTPRFVQTLCQKSCNLQKLVLFSYIFPDSDTALVLKALTRSSHTKLQEASLGLTCGTQGGLALAEYLQMTTALQKLWLRVSSLANEESNEAIAQALRTASPSLLEFGLYGEGYLSAESQQCFTDSLKITEYNNNDNNSNNQYCNTSLQVMELQSAEESEERNMYLVLNKIGRRQLLLSSHTGNDADETEKVRLCDETNNPQQQRWVEALVQVKHDLSCIYYLLNANPMLLAIKQ